MALKSLTKQQIQELVFDDDFEGGSWCSDDSVWDPDWGCPESSGDECVVSNQTETSSQENDVGTSISLHTDENHSKEPPEKIIAISWN